MSKVYTIGIGKKTVGRDPISRRRNRPRDTVGGRGGNSKHPYRNCRRQPVRDSSRNGINQLLPLPRVAETTVLEGQPGPSAEEFNRAVGEHVRPMMTTAKVGRVRSDAPDR
jgi:hypothetical protein